MLINNYMIKKYIMGAYLNLQRYIKINVFDDVSERQVLRWIKDKGDSTLRLKYPLNQNSIVFDCGGYMGGWSSAIFDLYHPSIYIFEPVRSFYEMIQKHFRGESKIHIFQYGLHNRTESTQIRIKNNSSSIYSLTGEFESIRLVDIKEFMVHHHISRINLMKINIEGGEYDLLDRIIENGIINCIDDLQIQFHQFVPNAEERRTAIREHLVMTHRLTYNYTFVWENWQKIKQTPE